MKNMAFSIRFATLLAFMSLAFHGCKEEAGDKSLEELFRSSPAIQLQSQLLNIEETEDLFFGKVLEMVYADGLLIIRDIDQNHRMKIIDLVSNRMVKFGKIGEGPNELISDYTRPSVDYSNRTLYVSDYPNYYLYHLDSLKNGIYDPAQKIRINLPEDNLIESTFSGGYIVGSLFRNRFGLHRLSDGQFSKMGSYEHGTYMSHQGVFYPHPTEKKAVRLGLFAEELTVLDFADGHFNIIKDYKGWSSDRQEIEQGGGVVFVIPPSDDRNCFMSCTSSEKSIFALYSGQLRSDESGTSYDPSYGERIYVFDWEGKPVKKLLLDLPVRSIALDERNQVLYASTIIDKNPKLVKFHLNEE